MKDVARTSDANFASRDDFPWEPNYHHWNDLRMHYLDEGDKDAPVMLLLHGMPTWAWLYRTIMPRLVDAGYRCIAPDHMGFGRSDKPLDFEWYTIARHTEILGSLIEALDLQRVTLLCQDWGGPIGLAQAVEAPERFDRLTIMNTWLHCEEHQYTDAIINWNAMWKEDGLFYRDKPPLGIVPLMAAGMISQDTLTAVLQGEQPDLDGEAARMYRGFSAPFEGLEDGAFNGARRFPLSLPFDNPQAGNAEAQTRIFEALKAWDKPAHFIWGEQDQVFTEAWGRKWAGFFEQSTFDTVAGAGHFLQSTHGEEVVEHLLGRITGR